MNLESVVSSLEKRGYHAQLCSNAQDAKQAVLNLIAPGSSVGIGGSVTMKEIEIAPALKESGCTVYWHMDAPAEDQPKIRVDAIRSDVYLLSANALTQDGVIVNIDGTGNRLAGSLYGTKKVVYVIGKNKITEDLPSALDRAHNVATPINARRLGVPTPCSVTGVCTDCKSPYRICHATLIQELAMSQSDTHIILVDQDLGF